jgi:ABC-type uncharacterized transport system substrate-binding protein
VPDRSARTTAGDAGIDIRSPDTLVEDRLRAFRQGLKDTGYVERENVAIEYRWAENQVDRLPELAAELVRRQVAVFVTTGGPIAVFAAKAATTPLPIVRAMSDRGAVAGPPFSTAGSTLLDEHGH